MEQAEIRVNTWMQEEGLLVKGSTIICACSGGADSMAMLSILSNMAERYDLRIEAAHFNHNIRGEESDRDEHFVEDYCHTNNIPYHRSEGDVLGYAKELGVGCEEAARVLRYEFLEGLVANSNNSFIATAHHADDNLETVLMKVMRGTGLAGLSGIPPKRDKIIRPLLCLTRDDIIDYLDSVGLSHVEDSTNATDEYSRNRIRHKVIPLLKEECPNISYNMLESCQIVRAGNKVLDSMVNEVINKAKTDEHKYSREQLLSVKSSLLEHTAYNLLNQEGIDPITKAAVSSVTKALTQNEPYTCIQLTGGVKVVRDYDEVAFYGPNHAHLDTEPPKEQELELDKNSINYGDYTIKAVRYYGQIPTDYDKTREFYVSPKLVHGEMTVRTRTDGDKIILNIGTKTLGKVYTQRKISRQERLKIPVIADSDGVIGVYGVGASLSRLAQPKDIYAIKISIIKEKKSNTPS